jgi:hypothetical protein
VAASKACADAAALKASMNDLDQLDPPEAGKAGVDGDSLLSSLPTVVKDLERIDAAWTSLEGQIDQDCG